MPKTGPAGPDPIPRGVMDLGAMAVVTAAITVEHLAPAGERVARALGLVIVAAHDNAVTLRRSAPLTPPRPRRLLIG